MAGVSDNPAENRFEMQTGAGLAIAVYRLSGNVMEIRHTEVPEELQGQGFGSQLVRGTLDAIRARGLKVLPLCPFVAAYMRRHPEYDDLRA